jgi:hypothetical protein
MVLGCLENPPKHTPYILLYPYNFSFVPYVSATCQLARDMAIAEKVSGRGPGGPMGAQSISPETTLNVLFCTRIFH